MKISEIVLAIIFLTMKFKYLQLVFFYKVIRTKVVYWILYKNIVATIHVNLIDNEIAAQL